MIAVHAVIAYLAASPEKVASGGDSVIPAPIGVAGFVWAGFRLKSGRDAAGVSLAIALWGLLLVLTVALAITKHTYQGSTALIVVQCALGFSWLVTLICTVRAKSAN